jgi:hypothetical protein
MANTPIFGWETPDDTDYVYQGAASIRTLGNAIDTSLATVNYDLLQGPRGAKSNTINTTAFLDVTNTTETSFFSAPAFTPLVGRNYLITITIGAIKKSTSDGRVTVILRKDNISGTILQTGNMELPGIANPGIVVGDTQYSTSFLATSATLGTTSFSPHVSISASANGFMAQNSPTRPGTILVQDVGV